MTSTSAATRRTSCRSRLWPSSSAAPRSSATCRRWCTALGAVIHTLNTRLDAALIAWQMNHCETQVLLTDRDFAPVMAEAVRLLRERHGPTPIVIDVCDSEYSGPGDLLGAQV
jgi:hypothetical protein